MDLAKLALFTLISVQLGKSKEFNVLLYCGIATCGWCELQDSSSSSVVLTVCLSLEIQMRGTLQPLTGSRP